jgi:uncharacterized SAM-binding protein YcdF (DUF218 family)
MSISFLVTNFISSLLLPPLNCLLLIALGWVIWRSRSKAARALVGVGVLFLSILSIPAVGALLVRGLEAEPLDLTQVKSAQAIVVLGAGRYRDAPEYGGDTVSSSGLIRLRYAATLYRSTGLPLLVTGGKPDGGDLSEAETMRRALVTEFKVPVKWVEEESENTRDSSIRVTALLRAAGIRRVLLVTHATHMRRSVRAFTAAGLEVVPAPTDFSGPLTILDFLPQAGGLATSDSALHEWIGIIWYRLRGHPSVTPSETS